ncbi:hypothetical protein PInf_022391 [Phytophthora infestans]|nr:hypothetical protein PInf_022391 [Phytophthora infestans]
MLHGAKRRRCVVLADGSAIGSYQRNSHETHTVVIEPSGHTYSYIQPDGTRTRHLTPTALSSHRPLVLDTLNLRNKFTDHAPYVHLRLMDSKNVRRLRRICAPRARWPRSEGNTKVSRLFNDQDKCFEMQSIEGAAKVRLHTSGKLIKVYYVVEVKVSDDDMEECSHAHYATLCRSFPARQTPEDFAFPVGVLLAAKSAWDKDREAEIEYNGESDDSPVVSQLPRNGAFAARPAFSVIATSNDGVQVDGDSESCLPLAEILRIATLPSKLLYQRVVAEVVGDDTTVFVSHREPGQLPEIVVQLDNEEEVENELGRFRAYRGGRIRVAFADRTILQVERNGESCSFFFPDGSTGQTTLASAPLRHRTYIYQALEFGDWAFASQEERMQRHEKRQEAQAIVARELRRINVRCGMNSELEVYNKVKPATKEKEAHADPSLALSLAAVKELQAATLAHIVSVDHALQAAASMATKDT